MSKIANYYSKDKAYKLYSSGMKLADIAKELDISANTISTWKTNDKWDEKNGEPTYDIMDSPLPALPDNKDLADQIKLKIATALLDPDIKPRKWRDILETIQILSIGAENKGKKGNKVEKDVTDLNDKELDLEIEQLTRLSGVEENEAEIVIPKRDVIEVE